MAGSKSRTSASTDAATDGVARVEIVTRGEVRREYTAEERAQILTEAAMPGARVLVVAQRHGISPSLVYRWRREAAGRPVRKARLAGAELRAAAGGRRRTGESANGVPRTCWSGRWCRPHRGAATQWPRAAGRQRDGCDGGGAPGDGARGMIALPAGARILLATQAGRLPQRRPLPGRAGSRGAGH